MFKLLITSKAIFSLPRLGNRVEDTAVISPKKKK
jgi:hypothetical protein